MSARKIKCECGGTSFKLIKILKEKVGSYGLSNRVKQECESCGKVEKRTILREDYHKIAAKLGVMI